MRLGLLAFRIFPLVVQMVESGVEITTLRVSAGFGEPALLRFPGPNESGKPTTAR